MYNHFKFSSRDEVLTRLFFLFSSRDEISLRQKRVNSKRYYTKDTDDFIPGRVSSRNEIIPVYGEMSLTVHTFLPR